MVFPVCWCPRLGWIGGFLWMTDSQSVWASKIPFLFAGGRLFCKLQARHPSYLNLLFSFYSGASGVPRLLLPPPAAACWGSWWCDFTLMFRITLPGISNCWQAPPPGWKLHKLRLRMSLAKGSPPGECKETWQAISCRDKRVCVQNYWAGRREFLRLHRVGLSSLVNSVWFSHVHSG